MPTQCATTSMRLRVSASVIRASGRDRLNAECHIVPDPCNARIFKVPFPLNPVTLIKTFLRRE
jgi:hypothetical protein